MGSDEDWRGETIYPGLATKIILAKFHVGAHPRVRPLAIENLPKTGGHDCYAEAATQAEGSAPTGIYDNL